MKNYLLFILMLLNCLIAYPQDVVNVNNIRYILEDGHALIGRQNKELAGDITIPDSISIDGTKYLVTGFVYPTNVTNWSSDRVTVEGGAFQSCCITSITLPNSISEITTGSFNSCPLLKIVNLPSSIKSIGAASFAGCESLQTLKIPSSVTTIGNFAFGECKNLKVINIPQGISSFAEGLFMNSGIDSIYIPQNVTSLCEKCLYLPNLKKVVMEMKDLRKMNYSSITFDNVSQSDLYVPKGSKELYQQYVPWSEFLNIVEYGDSGQTILPDQYNVYVDSIKYLLKNGYATIARQSTSLAGDVVIPKEVVYNGKNYLVKEMIEPTNITAYSSNTVSCDNGSFENCQIKSIALPNSIERIPAGAFQNCYKLEKVVLPDSVRILGEASFAGCCNLKNIKIPNSVTDLGSSSAYGYDSYVFGNCSSLKSITIPPLVDRLSSGCFKGAGLEELTIPASIKIIEEGSLDLPNLRTLKLCIKDMDNLSFSDSSFGDVSNTDLIVPKGSKQVYSEYYPWMDFKSISEFDDNSVPFVPAKITTRINGIRYILKDGEAVVGRQNKDLDGDITIPSSIEYNNVTYKVNGIIAPTQVTHWSSNTVSTENGAFQDCKITSIAMPKIATDIPTGAFYNCHELKKIILPDNIQYISDAAFAGCSSLVEIKLPESVSHIGEFAFGNCYSLRKVNIPKGIFSLPDGCFKGSGIETFLIPDNIKSLNESSFDVSNLKAIKICHKDFKDLNYTESTFGNVSNITLYVPKGSKKLYREFYPWKNFKDIIEYDDQYDSILYNAYRVSFMVPSYNSNAKSFSSSNKTSNEYTVEYIPSGISIETPDAPLISGYEFKGWKDVPSVMPARDIVLEAIYDQTTNIRNTINDDDKNYKVFDLNGRLFDKTSKLPAGIYILVKPGEKNQKILIK
jgi:hypothetical protein